MASTPTGTEQDKQARVIVLIYGMLEGGKPFWVYAAVKPSQYKAFQEAKKAGTLNVTKFDQYGEVIIAGEGQNPPMEVTLKIAEVYQTDPAKLFEEQDVEKALSQKPTE